MTGWKKVVAAAVFMMPLTILAIPAGAQTGGTGMQAGGTGTSGLGQQVPAMTTDKLVTLTCRQAWMLSGRDQRNFFGIVKQLAELSAQNREVTLPDSKAAGARAGEWIRTQAIKDPDQLLYAVVDHAVRYSIAKGRTTPVAAQ